MNHRNAAGSPGIVHAAGGILIRTGPRGEEIDQVIWLPAPEASSGMDHAQERELVQTVLGIPLS